MAVETPYITLNDGNKMPQVGFGLWKVNNDTCADTVYNAIKTGYRLFDGACGTYSMALISCDLFNCIRMATHLSGPFLHGWTVAAVDLLFRFTGGSSEC
jgi:hypothetical protein